MFAAHQRLHPPTSVDRCVSCCLTDPNAVNLVIARGNVLEIYTVESAAEQPHVLQQVFSATLSGTVRDICAFTPAMSPTDVLVVTFEDAKMSVAEWDPAQADLRILSLHFLEDEALRESRTLFLHRGMVRRDPQNRCISMLVYDDKLAVFPSRQDKSMGWRTDEDSALLDLPFRPHQVIDLKKQFGIANIKDIQFLDGYLDPTILVLHEPLPTWTGRLAVRKDTCHLTAITFRLEDRIQHVVIWSRPHLPHDVHTIVPVPMPQGGAYILGSNCIFYATQNSIHGSALNDYFVWGERQQQSSSVAVTKSATLAVDLTKCRAVLLQHNCLLLCTYDGSMYTAKTQFEGRNVRRVLIDQVGQSNVPTCATLVGENGLFLGSSAGDAFLFQYERNAAGVGGLPKLAAKKQKLSESEQNEGIAADLDDTSFNPPSMMMSGGGSLGDTYSFTIVDILNNAGPVTDMAPGLLGPANAKMATLMTSRGSGRTGSLCAMFRSVIPETVLSAADLGQVFHVWTVRGTFGPAVGSEKDLEHTHLVLGKEKGLLVFETGAQMQAVTNLSSEDSFNMEQLTVLISNIQFGHSSWIVQVCTTEVRLLRGLKLVSTIALDSTFEPYLAEVSGPYIAVLSRLGRLRVFECVGDSHHHSRLEQVEWLWSTSTDLSSLRITAFSLFSPHLAMSQLTSSHGQRSSPLFQYHDPRSASSTFGRKKKKTATELIEEELFGRLLDEMDDVSVVGGVDGVAAGGGVGGGAGNAAVTPASATSTSTPFSAGVPGTVSSGPDHFCFLADHKNRLFVVRIRDGAVVWSCDQVVAGWNFLADQSMLLAAPAAASSAMQDGSDDKVAEEELPDESSVFVESITVDVLEGSNDECLGLYLSLNTNDILLYTSFFYVLRESQPAAGGNAFRLNGLRFRRHTNIVISRPLRSAADSHPQRTLQLKDPSCIFAISQRGGARVRDITPLQMRGVVPRFLRLRNVNGQRCVVLKGIRPTWFFSCRRALYSHPMSHNSEVRHLVDLNNKDTCRHGFAFVDGKNLLHICRLPQRIRYAVPWPFVKMKLGRVSPMKVLYHMRTHTYIVCVSEEVERPRPEEELAFAQQNEDQPYRQHLQQQGEFIVNPLAPLINITDPDKKLPSLWSQRYEVRLYSAKDWSLLDSRMVPQGQQVMCAEFVQVAQQREDGRLDPNAVIETLAVGTANLDGEDIACRGKILMMRVVEAASIMEEDRARMDKDSLLVEEERGEVRFLPLLDEDISHGPVTSLSSVDGMIMSTNGRKMHLYEYNWQNRRLDISAFMDIDYFEIAAKKLKNYFLLGDVHRGALLLRWKSLNKVFKPLGHDPLPLRVTATEFMVDEDKLYLMVSDEDGNIHCSQYRPEGPEDDRGRTLRPISMFHVGSRVNVMLRMECQRVNATTERIASLYGCSDGSMGIVSPVSETSFRRLVTLSTLMYSSIPQPLGLHPKEYRMYKAANLAQTAQRRRLCRRVLADYDLLKRFVMLDEVTQRDLVRRIGTSQELVIDNLLEFDLQTALLQ